MAGDLSVLGWIELFIFMAVVIATILTAVNTARISDTLNRIEYLVDRKR